MQGFDDAPTQRDGGSGSGLALASVIHPPIVCRGTRGECAHWPSHTTDRSRRTPAPAKARGIRRLHNEGAMAIDPGTVVSRAARGRNS